MFEKCSKYGTANYLTPMMIIVIMIIFQTKSLPKHSRTEGDFIFHTLRALI